MTEYGQTAAFEIVNGRREPAARFVESPPGRLRKLMREALRFLPNLLKLAYRLARDPRVPQGDKIVLAATIAYVITPLDVLPDLIPFFGQIDDSYLIAVALLRLLNRTPSEVLAEHWEGPGDIRRLLNRLIVLTTFFLPQRVRRVVVGQISPSAAKG
ncbi:MAG: YkvA family protein [Chloracidobacterium sp.]|nr:YkvA family protein [Chloracidobacterium sp.]MDW8218747.1 YkvA family protein [Acidobacteriota bacterium]